MNIVYHLKLRLSKTQENIIPKHNLVICSIFKNEGLFIEEWIEYHLLIGVEHFYLFNNESTDNYRNQIERFIAGGKVTLIEWPEANSQIKAYKYWYDNYSMNTKWFTYLDLDEFICLKYEINIQKWLKEYELYPSVLVYWKMFGTGGQEQHNSEKLVIEQYTNSWPKQYNIGKVFYQSKFRVEKFDLSVHHFPKMISSSKSMNISFPPVNEYKYFVVKNMHLQGLKTRESSIQINHYWSKAMNIYRKKMELTDVAFKVNPKSNWDYFYLHEFNNTSSDFIIHRFIMLLKNKLKNESIDICD